MLRKDLLRVSLVTALAASAAACADGGPEPTLSPTPEPIAGPALATAESCRIAAGVGGTGCSVTATVTPGLPFMRQSSLSPVQTGPITIEFSRPVTSVAVSGSGAIWCRGFVGALVGYDSAGAQVARQDLSLIEPGDCAEDDVTFGAQAGLGAAKVKRVVIEPPSPFQFQFTLDGTTYNANTTAHYTLTFSTVAESPFEIAFQGPGANVMTQPSSRPLGSTVCTRAAQFTRSRAYTLQVRRDGQPAANQQVKLSLGAVEETGGHVNHPGPRPPGSFSSTTRMLETTVTTGADGRVPFRYYTPEFGGKYWVRAEVAGQPAKADTFDVGLAGLTRLTATNAWDYYGGGRDLHPDVWYATPRMAVFADSLADAFRARYNQSLGFNDMSLVQGGRFDIGGFNDAQHCSHRWGNTLDLRTNNLNRAQITWIQTFWKTMTGHNALYHDSGHGAHFHLQIAAVL